MGRKNKQERVSKAVRHYLEMGEQHTPEVCTLDIKSVAAAIGVSRTSLYKYGLAQEIQAAAQRQRERQGLSGESLQRRSLSDVIKQLRVELTRAEQRNKALVARLNIVEANAARLGIDPEELYRPLAKPVRSVSHAGRGARRR